MSKAILVRDDTASPSCLQHTNPSEAAAHALCLTEFLAQVSCMQSELDEVHFYGEAAYGLRLVPYLLRDKIAVASGEGAYPLTLLASPEPPSLAELLQAGAQVLEHRRLLANAGDRVEGLAGLLEDMAFDASMYLRQDEGILADALRTRAEALREAMSSMREGLPQGEQPAGAAKKV